MSVEQVCDDILALSDEDFIDAEAVMLNQANYNIPLAPSTTAQVRKLGKHRLEGLRLLKKLQLHLKQAENMGVE